MYVQILLTQMWFLVTKTALIWNFQSLLIDEATIQFFASLTIRIVSRSQMKQEQQTNKNIDRDFSVSGLEEG